MAQGDYRVKDNDTGDMVSLSSVWENIPIPKAPVTTTSDPYNYRRMYVLDESSKLYVCDDWTAEAPHWAEIDLTKGE